MSKCKCLNGLNRSCVEFTGEVNDSTGGLDWRSYARSYDVMCAFNPEYRRLLSFCYDKLKKLDVLKNIRVADLGGGTGNFSLICSNLFPEAKIDLYDNNFEMLQVANRKCRIRHSGTIRSKLFDLLKDQLPCTVYNITIMIHVLSHIVASDEQAQKIMKKIYNSLKEGGYFLIVDIGRCINVDAWIDRLFYAEDQTRMYNSQHLGNMRDLFEKYILPFNRIVELRQRKGLYYTHNLAEFERLVRGDNKKSNKYRFEIVESGHDLYNPFGSYLGEGLDDWVLARKVS